MDEDVSDGEIVSARALRAVQRNTTPSAAVLVPFTIIVTAVTGDEISRDRSWVWVSVAGLSAVCTLVSLAIHVLGRHRVLPTTAHLWALRVALASAGAVFGTAPWVGASGPDELTMLFSMFPATAAAMAAVVTAGRRDMFASFVVPLEGIAFYGLYSTGDSRLQGLALVSLFYTCTLPVLHHMVSRSLLESLRLHRRTEVLLHESSDQRNTLAEVNATLAHTNEQLAHQATHDPLTDLYNRRGTLDLLDAALDSDTPLALLYLDVDRFKSINDMLGHRGGDHFLQTLAERIRRMSGPTSFAGRIGGDEFVVVMMHHDRLQAADAAGRLLAGLAQPVHADGRSIPSSVSIGVACAPAHGTTSADLLRFANAALHRAKSTGRGRAELFDEVIRRELHERTTGELELRNALGRGEVTAYFQPELDATTGKVIGAELLARWVRQDGTVLAAAEFMRSARTAGLMQRVTEAVMDAARPHIRRMSMLGLPEGFRFRINVSPDGGAGSWRGQSIEHLIRGISPALLTIDVHEAAVNADVASASSALALFRACGGRVCLDDFAHGVSSLATLRRLPLDEVRIDRLSIDTLTSHPHDRAIVRSVIGLVRELGMTVTADGVETGAQADALIALGCVRHQGRLYGDPMLPDELDHFVLLHVAGDATSDPSSWVDDPRD
jgi:diguanylate cyclase (GGDEF)-like protein